MLELDRHFILLISIFLIICFSCPGFGQVISPLEATLTASKLPQLIKKLDESGQAGSIVTIQSKKWTSAVVNTEQLVIDRKSGEILFSTQADPTANLKGATHRNVTVVFKDGRVYLANDESRTIWHESTESIELIRSVLGMVCDRALITPDEYLGDLQKHLDEQLKQTTITTPASIISELAIAKNQIEKAKKTPLSFVIETPRIKTEISFYPSTLLKNIEHRNGNVGNYMSIAFDTSTNVFPNSDRLINIK